MSCGSCRIGFRSPSHSLYSRAHSLTHSLACFNGRCSALPTFRSRRSLSAVAGGFVGLSYEQTNPGPALAAVVRGLAFWLIGLTPDLREIATWVSRRLVRSCRRGRVWRGDGRVVLVINLRGRGRCLMGIAGAGVVCEEQRRGGVGRFQARGDEGSCILCTALCSCKAIDRWTQTSV